MAEAVALWEGEVEQLREGQEDLEEVEAGRNWAFEGVEVLVEVGEWAGLG